MSETSIRSYDVVIGAGPAATSPRSAPRSSASRRLHRRLEERATASPRWAAPASTSAAFRPRRCSNPRRTTSTPARVRRARHRRERAVRSTSRRCSRARTRSSRRTTTASCTCSRRTRSFFHGRGSFAGGRRRAAGYEVESKANEATRTRAKHVIIATGSSRARCPAVRDRQRACSTTPARSRSPRCRSGSA